MDHPLNGHSRNAEAHRAMEDDSPVMGVLEKIQAEVTGMSDGEVAARLDAFRTRQTADVLKAEL